MAKTQPYPAIDRNQLTDAEKHCIQKEWNNNCGDYPLDISLHQLFERQAAQTPARIAVDFDGSQLTYGELNQRANQLAHQLQKFGVGPETLVGVFMDQSIEMVMSLYAILKAGGAYVPVDPEYPSERVAFMLEDSQLPVLLTQQRLVPALPHNDAELICPDTEWETISDNPTEPPLNEVNADNLAYVIYTPGSTGRPKGAMNCHKAICKRLLWMQNAFQLTAADRVMQKAPFSFDVSVWEVFWPLLFGARLIVARPGGHRDSSYLVNLIVEQGITTIHFVPSMLQKFLDHPEVRSCKSLKRCICSGEDLSYDLQERFFAKLSAELHNLYGPTEIERRAAQSLWADRSRGGCHLLVL